MAGPPVCPSQSNSASTAAASSSGRRAKSRGQPACLGGDGGTPPTSLSGRWSMGKHSAPETGGWVGGGSCGPSPGPCQSRREKVKSVNIFPLSVGPQRPPGPRASITVSCNTREGRTTTMSGPRLPLGGQQLQRGGRWWPELAAEPAGPSSCGTPGRVKARLPLLPLWMWTGVQSRLPGLLPGSGGFSPAGLGPASLVFLTKWSPRAEPPWACPSIEVCGYSFKASETHKKLSQSIGTSKKWGSLSLLQEPGEGRGPQRGFPSEETPGRAPPQKDEPETALTAA